VSPPAPLKVLIVEDHPPTYQALRALLSRRGCQVEVASLVSEAVDRIGTADCIILDLMLPDGSGRDVLAAVRQDGVTARVVVTSGCADRDLLRDVEALRPDAVVRKPIDFAALLGALGLRA
jgi:CheY-like chemotaxis protein